MLHAHRTWKSWREVTALVLFVVLIVTFQFAFLPILLPFFFLPLHVANVPRILRALRFHAWVIPLLSMLFLLFR